ncbi:GNAT family N-acetyltransferase [Sinirhodobacter sp. WL0062]|uniref:GNAT family N-acetyltransferase n=1 Tax=Rhodobacter flavimaris TaxID=2907145 RepID=A0ABS8YXV1_9RHOB|nr:GNAT family N-acetyltransferase [Sinirhodobacter sp. WL0062]MCE5973412.1 GNAT family N-acetyltransferase [Sinirhodobacter sp. WL0062]
MSEAVEITLLSGVRELPAEVWDACACPEAVDGRAREPFTTHRFLSALETSGSVGPGTGWEPRPMIASKGSEIIAVAPLYLKSHSQGEYVFDHSWADAFERAGGRYYPKLQCAVPFTPVTGRRLLTRPGHEAEGRAALLAGMAQITANAGISSAHVTFCTEEETAFGPGADYLHRLGQQFHWFNRGYGSFEDFLADLSSRKRKAIRKERARAQGFGGTIRALTGDAIEPRHWQAMWAFYQDTGSRKWGRPYLTRAFFDLLHEMRDDVLLVIAERDGEPVAGALNLIGREALFGRYWGCVEDHAFLHFELCYHQAVDWAIAQGLARVEAGAQGDHKLARGYLPVQTHSLHWIGHPGLRRAVADYLEAERAAVDEDIAALTDLGPFRSG